MVDHKKSDRTRKIVEEFVFCLFRGEKTMPVLYYLPPSAPCRTVLLLGRLLNIEFELRVLDLMKGEHLKPEFIEVSAQCQTLLQSNDKCTSLQQINPQHTIPTLDDHGLILWER